MKNNIYLLVVCVALHTPKTTFAMSGYASDMEVSNSDGEELIITESGRRYSIHRSSSGLSPLTDGGISPSPFSTIDPEMDRWIQKHLEPKRACSCCFICLCAPCKIFYACITCLFPCCFPKSKVDDDYLWLEGDPQIGEYWRPYSSLPDKV